MLGLLWAKPLADKRLFEAEEDTDLLRIKPDGAEDVFKVDEFSACGEGVKQHNFRRYTGH